MPFLVELLCLSNSPCRESAHHLYHLPRDYIRCDADDSLRAYCHKGQRQRIVAAEDFKTRTESGAQLRDAVGVATGFLDADDVFTRGGETPHGVHADLDTAAARDAVEHDRQF